MSGRASHSLSIVIPVLNEQEGINGVIAHVKALEPAPWQVIVVDGNPAGSTLSAIRDHAVLTLRSEPGRGRQMNRGAAVATGDALLFLHADTTLPLEALLRIRDVLSDERIAGGAFDLGINSTRSLFRITERYVALRTRITRVPFGDQAIFIRRTVFERLGGFRDIPIMEDVDLMQRLRRAGLPIAVVPEKVMTSARRWEREGILFCTFRNWSLQAAFSLGVPAERLARWYR